MGWFARLFQRKVRQAPEADYEVVVGKEAALMRSPDSAMKMVLWADVSEVLIVTTDEGPWAPDVWLVMVTASDKVGVPQGANGYDALYDAVSKWDGFDYEAVIQAMSCAENAVFPVWKRM